MCIDLILFVAVAMLPWSVSFACVVPGFTMWVVVVIVITHLMGSFELRIWFRVVVGCLSVELWSEFCVWVWALLHCRWSGCF